MCKEDGASVLSMVPSNKTRGNRQHPKHRRFLVDTRRQVLAGTELIPFIVHSHSHGLYFVFVQKIVLII